MKVALLLCALLLIGCGKDSPSAPRKTYVDVSVSMANCSGSLCAPVVGSLTAVSAAWQSNGISLSPGNSVRVEVPGGGAYRGYFESNNCTAGPVYWDFTINAAQGQATGAPMTCVVP